MTQLVVYQLKVTQESEPGELCNELLTVLLGCQSQIYSGHLMTLMDVMTRIEQTFEKLRVLKGAEKKLHC